MTGFGLAYARKEGGVIHPDDAPHGYNGSDDAVYKDWLRAYVKDGNRGSVELEYCSRPHILKEILEEAHG